VQDRHSRICDRGGDPFLHRIPVNEERLLLKPPGTAHGAGQPFVRLRVVDKTLDCGIPGDFAPEAQRDIACVTKNIRLNGFVDRAYGLFTAFHAV
jgi:hypothetical protein